MRAQLDRQRGDDSAPLGELSERVGPLTPNTAEERRLARLTVAEAATDAADCALMLAALGLDDWPLIDMSDPPKHCAEEAPCNGTLARPCLCGTKLEGLA